MAIPAYGTDLQPVSLAEDTTGWAEMTGRTSGGAATQEDRAYIQGNYCVSQSTGAATGRTMGLQYDYGSNISWTSGFVFTVWQYWQAPKAMGAWADGGLRFAVGSAAGAVKLWNTGGNNYGRNPYGGWQNFAVDPTFSYDEIIGSPTDGAYRIFCSAPYLLQAVSKGNPHCVDAIRYGRGQIKAEYGSTSDGYATFVGMAAANDADSAKWGLFSLQFGSYIWKGLMSLGTATNAVDFRDANRNIVIDDTPRAYAAFNRVEIRNTSTRVDWTAINIAPYNASALSKGQFEVVDDADVNFNSCTFTDMDTFIFKSNSTVLNTIFRRCALVTQNGAVFNGCTFDQPSGAVGLLSDDLNDIDNTTFVSDGTGHAIELTSAHLGTSKTLTNVFFSGYGSDGTSNAAIYNNSGGAVTITITGGDSPTILNGTNASTTIVTSARTIKVIAQKADGTKVNGARILLRVAASASGGFPYDVTVTITNSGTTATVSHTSHGLVSTDKVQIKGASHYQNNGVFSITKINDNSYSYTMPSAPGSDPTGTIKATFVFLEGTCGADGELYMSKAIGANQAVVGWARKASDLLKEGSIAGTVVTTGDSTFTAILSPDA